MENKTNKILKQMDEFEYKHNVVIDREKVLKKLNTSENNDKTKRGKTKRYSVNYDRIKKEISP